LRFRVRANYGSGRSPDVGEGLSRHAELITYDTLGSTSAQSFYAPATDCGYLLRATDAGRRAVGAARPCPARPRACGSAAELDRLVLDIEKHIVRPDTELVTFTTIQVWGRKRK